MPELRKDPLIGRWVIIATERAKRPVDFARRAQDPLPKEECPFCEGQEAKTPPEIFSIRTAGGAPNAPGWRVRVTPSVNPVLRIEGRLDRHAKGMYDLMDGVGAHEMIVETPEHVTKTADLSTAQLEEVLRAAVARMTDLERDPRFRYVLWFKNEGPIAGSGRLQHVRSQLIATPVTPKRVKEELVVARRYFEERERCLLCDVLAQELSDQARIVAESSRIVALCPFASRFPFELCILPKQHRCDFERMSAAELEDLARVLKQVLGRLNVTLHDPPFNFVLHTAPFHRERGKIGHWKTLEEDYHWHIELMPRLTRLAGFEWGTGFYMNPTPPEEAARALREASREGAEPPPPP